jgi:hypothetical protein
MRRVVSAPTVPPPPTPTEPPEPLRPDGLDPPSDSDSDKENQVPTYTTNREVQEVQTIPSNWNADDWTWTPCDWSTTATTGHGPSPTDPPSDEEEEDPPTTLSYESFEEFIKSDERRADLVNELRDRACTSLIQLLGVFHETTRAKFELNHVTERTSYAQNWTIRLGGDVRDLLPVTFSPYTANLSTSLLHSLAKRTEVVEGLLQANQNDTGDALDAIDRQQRGLFNTLKELNLDYHGNPIFAKYGYLKEDPWSLAAWKIHQREYANPTNEQPEERWVLLPPDRRYQSYVDPQEEGYEYPESKD